MTKINEKAWAILTAEEKMAISLSLGYKKSSWEAGEIMSKSHYKFLEITSRAEKFLRMFTEYFDKSDSFIPYGLHISKDAKQYLRLAVLKRMVPRDIGEQMDNKGFRVMSYRDRLLEDQLMKIKISNDPLHKEFFHLILEFDRWNNFRILPRYWQQDSAFKRRIKSKELKYLKSICNLPPYSVRKLKEKFNRGGSHYTTIFNPELDRGFELISVVPEDFYALTQMGFPIFEKEFDAIEFAMLVVRYLESKISRTVSRVKAGLDFWAEFRQSISRARNFKDISGIIPNRKYQEDAFIEYEIKRRKRLKAIEKMQKI